MLNALIILIFIIVLLLLCSIMFIFGAWCGFNYKKRKKSASQVKQPTSEELSKIKQEQKELENFMNYTGKPQEAISG
jgi:cell division protein FtsB